MQASGFQVVYAFVHGNVYMHVNWLVCRHLCMRVCMNVCVYTCIVNTHVLMFGYCFKHVHTHMYAYDMHRGILKELYMYMHSDDFIFI